MANKVEATMMAGMRGELLRHHPLVEAARKNDAPFVIGIYGGATVVSLLLSVFLMDPTVTLVVDLLMFAAWGAIGYLFVAIGTRLSHNMATWGITLVASIIAVSKLFGNLSGAFMWNTMNTLIAEADIELPGVGGYVFRLIMFGVLAAGCIYLVVVMARAMKVMSPPPPAFPPPGTMSP
jgi:hypothetical protein